jgi:hypothetical protein
MMSEKILQKRYSLFVLAVLLLMLAFAAFVLASNSFAIRSLAIVALLLSVWLVRVSNVHRRSNPERSGGTGAAMVRRIGPRAWAVGAGCLLAAVIAYLYLRKDALNGYHQVLPVYVFAGVGLVCAVVWGYIAAKLLH